jgi:flagellar basal body P-ring protein FlgI
MIARNRNAALAAALVALLVGCQDLMLRMKDPKEYARKVGRENADAALVGKAGHAKLLGDYISVSGYYNVVIEGVGLVTNLDGTGEDIPVSPYRTMLLEDMKKRKIKDPNTLLRSTSTALVLVRAYLPPLIKKGEPFDVEIVLPDGSQSTSLAGGWLLECDLKEHVNVAGGGVREGRILGKAKGPILLATGEEKGTAALAAMKRGTIPGGATYVGQEDRSLVAMVRNDYQSAKLTHRIAQRIGDRFHDYDKHGLQQPMAEATTDRKIKLMVPERYRDNYPRYLQVVRNIQLRESDVEKHLRIQGLRERLQVAETSELASLQLEAIGAECLPILKETLKSPVMECRLRAAEALAYLDDASGSPVLKEVAATEPAFRIYALAALSTLNDGKAFAGLLELMSSASIETRYGAFRALSTSSPDDPNIRGKKMPGGFMLHIIESTGDPVIHLTRSQKAEIVLFGRDQRFQTPLVFRAGQRIIVKGDAGSGTVKVTRFAAGELPKAKEVSSRVADVILACSELDASYPDIVQMLVQAERQENLEGRIGIDDLPRAMRRYMRPASSGGEETEVEIGGDASIPNIFQGDVKPSGAITPEEVPDVPEEEPKPPEPITADLDASPAAPRRPDAP